MDEMKGIYLRKQVYWFRFSLAGSQHRVNLKTRDAAEAIKMAREIRKKGPQEKRISGKVWGSVIAGYISEKEKAGEFRAGTARKAHSALKVFGERCGAASPDSVTLTQLQKYYDTRRKNSEAGARSTMAVIQAFLSHVGHLPGRVKFAAGSKINSRQVIVDLAMANDWIENCHRDELKFVLFCGFHAGMRAGEIKHSRVGWFDLRRGLIAIPAEERQTLPNGKKNLWKTKDGDAREIPLSAEFRTFLGGFMQTRTGHVLKSTRGSADGIWDFRAPFENFMQKMGRPEVFPHAMRHSWITELTNSGNHSMQEVAAWSGDCLETIESNYWKKKTEAGALDATLAGKRKSEEEKISRSEIAELLQLVRQGKLAPQDVKELETAIDAAYADAMVVDGILKETA